MAEFLETAVRHRPDNVEALAELGHVYTRLGRLEEGLEVDRLLVSLVPDNPTVHYNLACSLALAGRPKDALDSLETAVGLGYSDAGFLLEDSDLTSLRAEPRFTDLVRKIGETAS
jgi:Flp pilus assembly protein TadD